MPEPEKDRKMTQPITAKMVAELRGRTGAGMMDCKNALVETGGDFERAVDLLKEKGQAGVAKRAGRSADQGLIAPVEGVFAGLFTGDALHGCPYITSWRGLRRLY